MTQKRYKYSILFRTIFTFAGFGYNEFIIKKDVVFIFLRRKRKTATCARCGRKTRLSKEYYKRTVRDLDVGPLDCYVTFYQNKVDCRRCGFRGHEKLSFIRPNSHCTIRFEEYVYLMCDKMSLSDVVNVTKIGWNTAKDIDIHYTKERLVSLKNIAPKRIGIDEVAYQKGHKYLTVVRDIDLGCVIWVGLDRKESTLDNFFDELGFDKQLQIDVAVTDMWDPYIASLKKHCPRVDIVFDKFHVVKKVNEALDEVRKKEFSKADEEVRKHMKKKRFLILKRKKNLTEKQGESLDELMTQNVVLYQAYILKEQIADILDGTELLTGISRLNGWITNVKDSGIEPLMKCVNTINQHYYGIANYFRHNITNAGSEGFNNKIGVIKRRAYGFWDMDYFMIKIYQACGLLVEKVT